MTVAVRAFLGLGSNLGDSRALLAEAVATLAATGDLVAVSSLYETEPVGGPEQNPFLNLVVELHTERSPEELLALAGELEQAADRQRPIRWGPRTLDVDVLLVGDARVDTETLTVPHPRMHERNFVMVPLLELAPDIVVDGWDPDATIGEVTVLGPFPG